MHIQYTKLKILIVTTTIHMDTCKTNFVSADSVLKKRKGLNGFSSSLPFMINDLQQRKAITITVAVLLSTLIGLSVNLDQ